MYDGRVRRGLDRPIAKKAACQHIAFGRTQVRASNVTLLRLQQIYHRVKTNWHRYGTKLCHCHPVYRKKQQTIVFLKHTYVFHAILYNSTTNCVYVRNYQLLSHFTEKKLLNEIAEFLTKRNERVIWTDLQQVVPIKRRYDAKVCRKL